MVAGGIEPGEIVPHLPNWSAPSFGDAASNTYRRSSRRHAAST